MRKMAGLAVLALGVLALGWWGQARSAARIEAAVAAAAAPVAAGSVHGARVTVEGRDITIRGLADGPAERDALIAVLEALPGRRVVVDALQVLPLADPFALEAGWQAGSLTAEGVLPDESVQAWLRGFFVDGPVLAAGAPDRLWGAALQAGIDGLMRLDQGRLSLIGRDLVLIGIAATPPAGAEVEQAVRAALPEGYSARFELTFRDDGSPPAYRLRYAADTGPWLEGKLPVGTSAGDVAAALGLADIDDGATVALMGEPGAVSPVLAALAPWLPEIETLEVSVAPEGTRVLAGFGAGADMELLGAALGADLARASQGLTLQLRQVVPAVPEGSRRVNALSGQAEVLAGGFWLPEVGFAPAPDTCAAQAEAVLAANRIGFVTGSARLDARARSAVNALAGVLGVCLQAGLRAEIGGHTDATGTDAANLALSRERAEAVRGALLARGVPGAGLSAAGYGASQPLAGNDTEAGRAANRRTAVRWIE